MNLLPWQSFELQTDLSPGEVVRLLQHLVPACVRSPDRIANPSYFCGFVDERTGWFRLQPNTRPKARNACPTLVGRIRPWFGERGTWGSIIEASFTPSILFWIGLLIPCFFLMFSMIGIAAWLFGGEMKIGDLVMFIVISMFGAAMTSWFWGTLIGIHYFYISRYRGELSRLLVRVAERTPTGQFVVELPETPEQRETKRQLRTQATQNGLKVIAVILAVMGGMIFMVGLKGVVTRELTTYQKNRYHGPGATTGRNEGNTISGDKAVTASQGLFAISAALVLASGVCWLVSRRDPTARAWPPLETTLLAIVAVLGLIGLVLIVRGYS